MLLGGYGLVDAVERLLCSFGALLAPEGLALPVAEVEHVVGDLAVRGQDVALHEFQCEIRCGGLGWRAWIAPHGLHGFHVAITGEDLRGAASAKNEG